MPAFAGMTTWTSAGDLHCTVLWVRKPGQRYTAPAWACVPPGTP